MQGTLSACGLYQSEAGIRNGTKPSLGIRSGIKVVNCGYKKIKYLVITDITTVLKFSKNSNENLKICRVFAGSFMKPSGSLESEFLSNAQT
jgi:hypothetical protein